MRSGRLAALVLALLLSAPLAGAQDDLTADVEVVAGETPVTEAEPGSLLSIAAIVHLPEGNGTSWRAFLNGSVADEDLEPATQLSSRGGPLELSRSFNVPLDAEDSVAVAWVITVQRLVEPAPNATRNGTGNATDNETDGNATAPAEPRWETAETFDGATSIAIPAPPPPPGPPVPLYLAAAVLVLLLVAALVLLKRRPRQIKAAPRSRTLQELEEEDRAARSAKRTPVTAPERAEPEVHPQVKILEARAKDVKRLIGLAKERHEMGQITEHQFKMIRDKKEAELERIHQEIEELGGS